MESLTVPKKFNRCGIKVKCLRCKWQLNGKTCHQDKDKPASLSKCQHTDQHRYNLVISVPNGNNTRRMKIIETKNFDTALVEMNSFREELNVQGYHKSEEKIEVVKTTFLRYGADYLNSLSGVNTPLHLVRKVTPRHLCETKSILKRFGKVLQANGHNLEILELKDIGDYQAELFYKYLKIELKLSNATYNRYFTILKSFFNWAARVKNYNGQNPFAKAKLTFEEPEIRMFTKLEFKKILEATTPENGPSIRSGENRNYYRTWLIDAYRLCLETGERGEPYVNLKWNDLITIENGVELFGISNLKPNRIMTGQDKGKYVRYIPVTKSLKRLLVELGYDQKKGTDAFVLEGDEDKSRAYLMELTTRSFTHFAAKAGVTGLTIKNLRKTYITKLTMAMGDKARLFTGHQSSRVIEHHYLSKEYLASSLNDFDIL
jgi:integrase